MSFHLGTRFNVDWISASICFSVGLFLAMARPLLKKSNNKAWNLKSSYSHFSQQITRRSRYKSRVVSELKLFNRNSARADVVMRAKVTFIKVFVWKQVRHNNGFPILIVELWRKTKQWYKRYEKYKLWI